MSFAQCKLLGYKLPLIGSYLNKAKQENLRHQTYLGALISFCLRWKLCKFYFSLNHQFSASFGRFRKAIGLGLRTKYISLFIREDSSVHMNSVQRFLALNHKFIIELSLHTQPMSVHFVVLLPLQFFISLSPSSLSVQEKNGSVRH